MQLSESVQSMTNIDLKSKRVLIREDFNVPINDGVVTSDARLKAGLPTILHAMNQGAQVMIMSHLGRPKEGVFDAQYSMKPVADYLSKVLGKSVPLITDLDAELNLVDGEVVLFENVRFNQGEKTNADALAQVYARLCDVFVMDAFGTSHRAHASTHGVAKYAPTACAGPLLLAELEALGKALENPANPLVVIVGGSKVSTKLTVLESLSTKVDCLVLGGGIANTFLAAQGYNVGDSLCEVDLIPDAKRIMDVFKKRGARIVLPSDVVIANEFSEYAHATMVGLNNVPDNAMILDVGTLSQGVIADVMSNAGTIVWNGPVGVFELAPFAQGTESLAYAVANSPAFTIAGGGDTLAAIDAYGIGEQLSYISTGGGAFLEFLEGKKLPVVSVLQERCN